MIRAAVFAAALATPVTADTVFEFCWIGDNGYRMAGKMSVRDDAVSKPLITQLDVTGFAISGYRNGVPVGSWSLDQRTSNTSWHLNFDPQTLTFTTGGTTAGPFGQQWNADGGVRNCGVPGFGFNSGNFSQDLCVDGVWIEDSIIDPATPFVAFPAGAGPDCFGSPLLGALPSPSRLIPGHAAPYSVL